jgi:hypothetical protein
MRMPTHIVIDTRDGWTWARDRNGNPFTEGTATVFRNLLNDSGNTEGRTYVMAAVTPVMSRELMAAIVKHGQHTQPMIEGKEK